MIVQLPPGFTTTPETQVPPVTMLKVPFPPPPVLAIVGLAVSVSGPVAAAALLTVMVPDFVVVPPVLSAGVGAEIVTVAPCTVNAPVKVLVAPAGVITVTFLAVRAAVEAIVNVVVTVVSFTTTGVLAVTPAPDTFTADAPVRPRPLMVTGTLVPRTPVVGLIEASPVPVPVMVVVKTPPVVVTVSVPTCGPVVVGANRTRKVQVAAGARVVPTAHVVAGPRLY